MSAEFEKVHPLDDDWLMDSRFNKASRYTEDKDSFDEGISVSESNVEEEEDDDNDDDDENDHFLRHPKTEFEKSISKIGNMTRQIDQGTQLLSHDLVREGALSMYLTYAGI